MKKLLSLSLMLSLGLATISPAHAAQAQQVSPTLKAVLHKKFIQRKKLTPQEQAYLSRAGKVAIAAALVALGIGAGYAALRARSGEATGIKKGDWYAIGCETSFSEKEVEVDCRYYIKITSISNQELTVQEYSKQGRSGDISTISVEDFLDLYPPESGTHKIDSPPFERR